MKKHGCDTDDTTKKYEEVVSVENNNNTFHDPKRGGGCNFDIFYARENRENFHCSSEKYKYSGKKRG